MMRFLLFILLSPPLFAKQAQVEADPFIKRIFEITIPGFEGAYNASIMDDNEGYLLAFRHDTFKLPIGKHKADFKQWIGLVELNAAFEPVSEAKICLGDRTYDPRLLSIGGKIYLIYASPDPLDSHSMLSSHLNLAEIVRQDSDFYVASSVPLSIPFQNHWEKNWVLFDFKGVLHLEYTIDPQVVALPDHTNGICEPVSSFQQKINWPYGIIRGGTPAIEVDGEYLGFFHSSKKDSKTRKYTYYVGAYTFSKTPPFKLTRISKKPFQSPQFYTAKKNGLTRSQVLFPCGFAVKNNDIFVSYGENDAAIKIMVLDKAKLLKSLIPVE
ncbi:MAG: hypothetical protein KDK62_00840 [Chlamydiia bacterium]|nr:hypothetical protein [Chlamydiia bacterium]